MQGAGAGPAEHRMLYTALVYTPDKKHHRYLVDFELDVLAEQLRSQAAQAVVVVQVDPRSATAGVWVSDSANPRPRFVSVDAAWSGLGGASGSPYFM